jgi:hypothetical protein
MRPAAARGCAASVPGARRRDPYNQVSLCIGKELIGAELRIYSELY